MKIPFLTLTIFLFIFSISAAQGLTQISKDISTPKISSENVYALDKFEIDNGEAKFKFGVGKFFVCDKLNDENYSFIFEGLCQFVFTPTNTLEKEQLKQAKGSSKLTENCNYVYIICNKSIIDSIISKGKQLSSDSEMENVLSFIDDVSDINPEIFVVRSIINKNMDNTFYAHIDAQSNPLFYMVDPYKVDEEVYLIERNKSLLSGTTNKIINQFKKIPSIDKNNLKKNIPISDYHINFNIDNDLDVKAKADIQFVFENNQYDFIELILYKKLKISSITWENGEPADYYLSKSGLILIKNIIKEKLNDKISIHYYGDLIEENNGWPYAKSQIFWYPNSIGNFKSNYSIEFKYPSKYTLLSVGSIIDENENDDFKYSKWETKKPYTLASFNIGKYEEYIIDDERIPETKIYMSSQLHKEFEQYFIRRGITSGKDMEEQVGEDVTKSYVFFQHLFGKTDNGHLYVTETPYSHGLAFPELIHLSWSTFQRTDDKGYDELFRAHEVAHQWWGVGVDNKTYHDNWLVEGLAEFCGLLYLQTVREDKSIYFDILDEWKENILSKRDYIFSSGLKSGPIWLGYRNAFSDKEDEYKTLVYEKSAWVFHMLRMMLIDLRTMNEDRFNSMLKDFYQSNKNKEVSTQDFKLHLDKHFNTDMQWFIDQWIYNSDIPEYEFSYTQQENANGKFDVELTILQKNIANNFTMKIPIKIDFGEGRFARISITANGPTTKIKLPPLAMEAEDIIFNDLNSVLCEID